MLFTQAVSDYRADSNTALLHQDAAQRYFGSLVDSMLTLFMSLAGGVSWEQALAPLREISAIWVICYVGYIAFTYFAVLNEQTSVSPWHILHSCEAHDEAMLKFSTAIYLNPWFNLPPVCSQRSFHRPPFVFRPLWCLRSKTNMLELEVVTAVFCQCIDSI